MIVEILKGRKKEYVINSAPYLTLPLTSVLETEPWFEAVTPRGDIENRPSGAQS
jgi:hypothetical protein